MSAKFVSTREQAMAAIQLAAIAATRAGGMKLQSEVRDRLGRHASNRGSGGVPSAPGSPPGLATGALSRSVQRDEGQITNRSPKVRVGSSLPYARIQEFGGRISAKNKPWLTFQVRPGVWRRAKTVTLPARPYLRATIYDAKAMARVNREAKRMFDLKLKEVGLRGRKLK